MPQTTKQEQTGRSEIGFAPGPWQVGRKTARLVFDADDNLVAQCDTLGEYRSPAERRAVEEANARLIAQAPVLYDIVRSLRDGASSTQSRADLDNLADKIEAVLNAVEGK